MSAGGLEDEPLDIVSAYRDTGLWARREVGAFSLWLPEGLRWPRESPDDLEWGAKQINGRTLAWCYAQLKITLDVIDEGHEVAFDPDEWLDLTSCLVHPGFNRMMVAGFITARRHPGRDEPPSILTTLPIAIMNEAESWVLTLFGPVNLGERHAPGRLDAADPGAEPGGGPRM